LPFFDKQTESVCQLQSTVYNAYEFIYKQILKRSQFSANRLQRLDWCTLSIYFYIVLIQEAMENNFVLGNTDIMRNNTDGFSLEAQLRALSSFFQGLFLAVKVCLLLALSIIYTLIAVPSVILYMIFYKHLFEKLIRKVRQEKRKAPYYYKWKKHHLDLNWEA
jgi:hypothetical protein